MKDTWQKDVYVLIPSYKSLASLKTFLGELLMFVPAKHVCVIDDASNDGTFEYCASAGVIALCHETNKGKGAALRSGFSHLTQAGNNFNAKWFLTMDADGQHSPADIHKFIKEIAKSPDMGLCIGARDMRFGIMPPARIFSNRVTSAIMSIFTRRVILDCQCGYRLYSQKFINSIEINFNRFEMESEVIIKAAAKNFPVRFVRVQTLYLTNGQSHISHLADTLRWVKAVLKTWHSVRREKRKTEKTQ